MFELEEAAAQTTLPIFAIAAAAAFFAPRTDASPLIALCACSDFINLLELEAEVLYFSLFSSEMTLCGCYIH